MDLLRWVRENPARADLVDTPMRVIKAYREMTSGYQQEPEVILDKVFKDDSDEMVVVSGMPFYSLCEHHLLPFFGTATVAYIPTGGVVGLSKIPRLVECFSKRLQVQERLTTQIADAMMEHINPIPAGAAAILSGVHTCMSMRGVRSDGQTTTSALRGAFRDDKAARSELLNLHRAAQ